MSYEFLTGQYHGRCLVCNAKPEMSKIAAQIDGWLITCIGVTYCPRHIPRYLGGPRKSIKYK